MKFIIVLRATDDVLWQFNNLPKRCVKKKIISSIDVLFCPLDKLPKKMGHKKLIIQQWFAPYRQLQWTFSSKLSKTWMPETSCPLDNIKQLDCMLWLSHPVMFSSVR